MKPGIKNSGRGVLFFLAGIFLWGMTMGSDQVSAVEAMNVRLVGHNDLQGRETLQVVLKGNYAYVGHHKGDELNPLTGKVEPNGTSIIDVSNPAQPKLIVHIPGYKGAQSRAVQIVDKFYEGKDFILRNQEAKEFTGFEIWEVTDRAHPQRVSTIGPHQFAETKDGAIIGGALVYVAYFAGGLRVVDISDPFKPREVGYYVPDTNEKTKPRLKKVIQTNDVDLDYRGLIYITDRAGSGLHILEYTGRK